MGADRTTISPDDHATSAATSVVIHPHRPTGEHHRGRQIGGTLLGLAAALGYTLTNVCLRRVVDCDAIWVSCMKSIPTVLVTFPFVVARLARRQSVWGSWRNIGVISITALIAQLAGNVMFQWALGIVGLAIAVPATLSSVIIGSATLGRFVLRETVTVRTLVSISVILVAIFTLSLGASQAHEAIRKTRAVSTDVAGESSVVLGVAACCLAGFVYSALGAVIRWSSTRGSALPAVLFLVSIIGALGLGGMAIMFSGWEQLFATSGNDRWAMAAAGIFNAAAFFSLTLAMRWSGLVYVNLLNGSQTAMAATIGVLFFHEAFTAPLVLGVLLTLTALAVLQQRDPAHET